MKLFAAVVIKTEKTRKDKPDPSRSGRQQGDWSCFLGETAEEASRKALEAKIGWEAGGNGPYEVLAGELTDSAVIPVELKKRVE